MVASKFSFDGAFQSKIAALSVRDPSFARRCDGLIKGEYFDTFAEGVIVDLAFEYFSKYRALPGSKSVWTEILKDALKTRRLRKEAMEEVTESLRLLLGSGVSDREFVVEKVSEFARHQAVQEALIKAVDLSEDGKMDEAQGLLEQAFRVGAHDEVEDVNYWDKDQMEARAKYREDIAKGLIPKDGIPTGIKKIDSLLYHEGWGRKELSVLMGGAKKGKSMGLGYFAGRASVLGYNVLYMTLEVSTSIIADREDAFLSDTSMKDLGKSRVEVVGKMDGFRSRDKKPGELRIMGFPSGTLTCRQISRVIERYRSEGLVFDMIVVDYADIMAPDRWTNDAIENSKSIWLGLRAIAHVENVALLTATQTNREGFKEATAKAENVADDFNKIRIADLVISINRTDEEKAVGEARLYFAASRNQEGEFAVRITQELDKMKFITSVKAIV